MSVTLASERVMNLAEFLSQTSRRDPGGLALAWGDLRLTWAALDARVSALALHLARDHGVQPGDRLLVQSPNCNQLFELMFACFRLGAVYVPVNFRLMPQDVAKLAQSSGAVGFVHHSDFADHAAACREASAALRFCSDIRNLEAGIAQHQHQPCRNAPVLRDTPCWLFYTSGTTGLPKGAILTHGQMAFVINNHLCDLMPGLRHGETALVVAPLSHGAGVHHLAMVARGVTSVLSDSPRFDAAEIWRLIEDWRVVTMFTVPTILKMIVEADPDRAFDSSTLRFVIYAGAPMYRADQIRALNRLGPVLVQYYGLGEVTGAITVLPPHLHSTGPDFRIGTCGLPRTGMLIEVQDASGQALPPGETGEICVIGPAVVAGYHDNPAATDAAFRDGWFRTGDLGHMDAEGYLYLTDRASDMFISGGSNIYPREIEEKILALDHVAECAVLGVPDARWGEAGFAIVVLRPGVAPDEAGLRSALAASLASYKLPRHIRFFEALPKTGYGKISKKDLRQELRRRGFLPEDQ
ncbi:acyl-CoA synthetase [Pseudomonas sp. GX19020]|uniref:acyl-CoA synthetase n=1 Tax=Pseudomonas sp. GX19020 TaxID=2942277 RepID=UPI002018CEE5|nr:acyl-CoA synthetase [Pseudomonas sp. GX19020]MCL4068110.1 acyl-CoA synthetase [Pseudomonas sp. GX19020]